MTEEIKQESISVSKLLLDNQNPRLPNVQENQRDGIREMAKTIEEKIIALAEHLVDYGPNPASLPIVMPSTSEPGMFDVLDGNRRLTALKLLESPQLAEGIIVGGKLKKLKQLSLKFARNPISELECIIFPNRAEADNWIQLIHRGQNLGAGLVEWDGQVAARYDARMTGVKPYALQVLDYVREHGTLSEETMDRIDRGKFPITNLERLINTPYIRKKLGVEILDGKIEAKYPSIELLKGLNRIVDDIGQRRITVSDIKRQDQRIDYINSFNEDNLPDTSQELDKPCPLEESGNITPSNNDGARRRRKAIKNRTKLIPRNCSLNITNPRINYIYKELQKLNINDFPNSGAVMFRVFIELSLDHCLEHKIGWGEQQLTNSSLAAKLRAVKNYFENNAIMTQQQLDPIRRAADGQTLLAASVRTMNGFVHNRFFSPVASELKTAWDDFQLFIENIWPF